MSTCISHKHNYSSRAGHSTATMIAGIALILSCVALGVSFFSVSEVAEEPAMPLPTNDAINEFVLTPKDQLEVIQGNEGTHWTFAPEVPPKDDRTEQKHIIVKWETSEAVGDLDLKNDVQYEFWGFEGSVPGPVLRIRQGDVIEFHLTNNINSKHPHNIDFHFSTGPGGGAPVTKVNPGETAVVNLRALKPGFYMYHCATPDVSTHIVNGMYGGVIVDPVDALPTVDEEFYVVQSEFYTENKESGLQNLDAQSIINENPHYMVFNGSVGSLLEENAPRVHVGDAIRIYMLNAGLNLISSFHVIGEIFDRVYREADVISAPAQGVQTTLVPAGGSTIVDFTIDVPGTYILVDHALSRAFHKGLIGHIIAEGDENFEIYEAIEEEAIETSLDNEDETKTITKEAIEIHILEGSWEKNDDPLDDYDPYELKIKVGTTVTWINDDTTSHTATADDGSFDSGFLKQGESWSYTFNEVGEFGYFCLPHPWMRGSIIVEE